MNEANDTPENREITRSGVRYIVRTLLYVILHALLFFIAAGTLNVFRGWLFYIMYLSTTVIHLIIIAKKNPKLINQRAKAEEGTKSWDKIILAIWIFLLILIDIIAGLDIGRFHWTSLSFLYAIIGIVLWSISIILTTWAQIINIHFEATVRIQKERHHQVINSGPYQFVRHPGYLGLFFAFLAYPLIFGSILTFIPAGACIILFIIRTHLEDKTLHEELPGYAEYAEKTKYRLIPRIW